MFNKMRIRNLHRSYRRFRRENQHTASVLIFTIDTLINAGKLAGVAIVLGIIWLTANTLNTKSVSIAQSEEQTTVKTAVMIPSATTAIVGEFTETQLTGFRQLNVSDTSERAANVTIVYEQWVLEQNPEHFIIQFGTSEDLDLMKRFAAEFATTDPIAIYHYDDSPSGKPVYGIASSLHNSLDAGLDRVRELPTDIRLLGPWVRPLKKIQRQIGTASAAG